MDFCVLNNWTHSGSVFTTHCSLFISRFIVNLVGHMLSPEEKHHIKYFLLTPFLSFSLSILSYFAEAEHFQVDFTMKHNNCFKNLLNSREHFTSQGNIFSPFDYFRYSVNGTAQQPSENKNENFLPLWIFFICPGRD